MKFKFSLLLFFIIFFIEINAEIIFDDSINAPAQEEIINYDSVENEDPEDSIVDENLEHVNSSELLKDITPVVAKPIIDVQASFGGSKNLFLAFTSFPKKVIINQRVAIDIKATVTKKDIKSIQTVFSNSKTYKILNPNTKWKKNNSHSYINRYYIKFLTVEPELPTFSVSVDFDSFIAKNSIKLNHIKVVTLKSDKFFSGVIASDLKLESHSEKKYDDKKNIILMEISAKSSNLSDFSLKFPIREGVDEFIDNNNEQKIFYFAIVDNSMKYFKFRYFDYISNKYILHNFKIVLQDQTLSTQTELNPKKNRYILYKTIALLIFAFLLIVIFIIKRKYFALVLAILILIYVGYTNIPMNSVMLKKGTGLKILPTQNSTVFYILEDDISVDIVHTKGKYIKVLLENKKIGWINSDDI